MLPYTITNAGVLVFKNCQGGPSPPPSPDAGSIEDIDVTSLWLLKSAGQETRRVTTVPVASSSAAAWEGGSIAYGEVIPGGCVLFVCFTLNCVLHHISSFQKCNSLTGVSNLCAIRRVADAEVNSNYLARFWVSTIPFHCISQACGRWLFIDTFV